MITAAPLLGLISAVPLIVGVLRADRERPDWPVVFALLALAAAMGIALSFEHEEGVPRRDLFWGVLLGAAMLGWLPAYCYYALGRALSRRRGVLAAVWLVSLVPLAYYCLFMLLLTMALVHCPPDAYECPV